jgi:hypothetical protein
LSIPVTMPNYTGLSTGNFTGLDRIKIPLLPQAQL